MLNLDALVGTEQETTILVKLDDPGLTEKPILTMIVPDVKTCQKLFRRYFKPTLPLNQPEAIMEMTSDDVGYAVAMCKYVTGWEGIAGEFDRKKLERFFQRYERIARAFTKGIQTIFDKLETDALQHAEALEKN